MLDTNKVRNLYSEAYHEHGNSIKSLFIPKGRQKERFDILTTYIQEDNFSILDYGCGLAHLKAFLNQKFNNFSYNGADIVSEFIIENRNQYPNDNFQLINSHTDLVDTYDFIISAGVFNILYQNSVEQQENIVKEILTFLFAKTNKVLSVDFMTDQVDFMQEGSFHQNVVDIYNFVSKNLSKRLVINQSYMPYEFTIHIFKDQQIIRPDNIYPSI